MKQRTNFRGRVAVAAALGLLGLVAPLGSAQASPADNTRSDPSSSTGPNSLAHPENTQPATPTKDKRNPMYLTCEQVWSLGKGPIRIGQPGYSAMLDPDGDGIACDR
ncbi:hypothetical protein JMUB6875_14250 [Nocardia sp. JMUB6875]|uniref:excalibur calcium-binding domain-containing protein n=1 Tax=Nocardia sp. JMUB6875 TaxID=3158170 RepID=UPI0032E600B8